MEFVAVASTGVHIYKFSGDEVPAEPDISFPAVPNADGCAWSSDGNLIGLADTSSGGIVVYNAANEYQQLCEVTPQTSGPIRSFYFSPLGTHIVTWERYLKESGNNVALWDTRTGEMQWSFILKTITEMNWPPLKWTALETHCCRQVQDGLVIMNGQAKKDGDTQRITIAGMMGFEVAPKGGYVAICIAESKGVPAKCQIFKLDDPSKPTATKSFFKAQKVSMRWNNTGTALLVLTSMEVDDTGKNYYGNTNLYFMRPDGQEDCIVASADQGPVHDVQWSPTQDEFILCHGDLPCNISLHTGKKGAKTMDFGKGHRNTIRWNNFGRFFVVAGFGQLVGDVDFWDKPGKKILGSTRMECCVLSSFAPDGRTFMGATIAPRMRVDNKIVLYDYVGQMIGTMEFKELLSAGWRPRPRGAFNDRPPSPGRQKPVEAKSSAVAAPKKQAYVPPGARSSGGLAALLRQELGSTSGESSGTATKVLGNNMAAPLVCQVPGAAPVEIKAEGASANSRNARKKKAKEAAQQATEAEQPKKEPEKFKPAERVQETAQEQPAPAGSIDNPEVEKKVRALKKKLRDIEKLKERPANELDPLQREKIKTEVEIVSQIRALGGEP